MADFVDKIKQGWRETRGNFAVELLKYIGSSSMVGAIYHAFSQAIHRSPVDWFLFGCLFLFGVVLVVYSLYRGGDKPSTTKLEQEIEDILVRKGVLPDSPQAQTAPRNSTSEDIPNKDIKLDGEAYRVVTAPKGAFADMTRQLIEGMGKTFVIDVDVLIHLYVVNVSTETQYIRDFCASVEISGERIEMIRQKDFDAWEVNGTEYEYCLDPDPNASKFDLESRAEPLTPLFTSLPVELSPRKPLEGWIRFLLKEVDPKKLEENRTYVFRLVDSLGDEHLITRAKKLDTESRISAWRKGINRK